jgi:peptidoglycan/xylan/chitin deacetylase (PgdA/CDA1 family)
MKDTLYLCWTIDCESTHPAVNDKILGRNAVEGFAGLMEAEGWRATFFVTPEEAAALSDTFGRMVEAGHEVGLHPHPASSGYPSDHLGRYSPERQAEIAAQGRDMIASSLGTAPASCRPGYGSANDFTFPVLAEAGFHQTSASFPGRRVPHLASLWAGAPLFAHYANPHNRCLENGLDLVEIPISVDWESMIWGGAHPLDLRVEFTDAKNHAFLIEKLLARQCQENIPLKAIVPLTHNVFRFDEAADFRRLTVQQMAADLRRLAEKHDLEIRGTTIAEAATAFRTAVPFEPLTL